MCIENAECIQLTKGLIRFLQDSPTSFHAVANIAGILREAGFTELHEDEKWEWYLMGLGESGGCEC